MVYIGGPRGGLGMRRARRGRPTKNRRGVTATKGMRGANANTKARFGGQRKGIEATQTVDPQELDELDEEGEAAEESSQKGRLNVTA
jgi:hypothetical protein